MIGRLIWNQDRPDIVFDTGTLYGGLHCGDCFACWLDGRWLDVRAYIAAMEMKVGKYLKALESERKSQNITKTGT